MIFPRGSHALLLLFAANLVVCENKATNTTDATQDPDRDHGKGGGGGGGGKGGGEGGGEGGGAGATRGPVVASEACKADLNGKLPSFLPSNFKPSGNVRTYYVQAEQVLWDYAPTGWDNWLGVPMEDSPRAKKAKLTKTGTDSFGSKWLKALYRGYTDETFRTRTEQPNTQGLNGPTMRAEVGDLVQVLFVNALEKNFASMHSMGLGYSKEYEGSLYPSTVVNGEPKPAKGDAVPAGGCVVYKWLVPESSAPAQGEDSIMWSYHSYVNMEVDLNAGLQGPMIVYQPGGMERTMATRREFVLLYANFVEAGSFLAEANQQLNQKTKKNVDADTNATMALNDPNAGGRGGGGGGGGGGGAGLPEANSSFWAPQLANTPKVTLTEEQAPVVFALNGNVFSNLPAFEMCQEDQVTWHVYAYGSMPHVFHLHGHNFQYKGMGWQATASINDGNMKAFTMQAVNPGTWQALCHVSAHLSVGMESLYHVYPKGQCPLKALG